MLAEPILNEMNPERIRGNFVSTLSDRKANLFKHQQWENLCLWNAAEVMGSATFDLDDLVLKMQHDDLDVRNKNQRFWFKKIDEYAFKGKAQNIFMDSHYNGPHIKLPTKYSKHYTTISNVDITWILVEHRAAVAQWYVDKKLKEKEDPDALRKIQRQKYKNACQQKTWGKDKGKVNAALMEWDAKHPVAKPAEQAAEPAAEPVELVIEQVDVDDWEDLE